MRVIHCISETEIRHLNLVWHRLTPWDDAREGLEMLRQRFIVATLSNGNVALLTNMSLSVTSTVSMYESVVS